jgi:hypothetical protein
MASIGLKIGAGSIRFLNTITVSSTILTVGGVTNYTLVDGTIAGIEIAGITYTTDIHGQNLMISALLLGPVLAIPSINEAALTVGEATGFEDGIRIYGADAGHPIMTMLWFVDGVTTIQGGDTYTTDTIGTLTLQQRASQPNFGNRVAVSPGVVIEYVSQTRSVSDIVAEHGGNYFDFSDLTRMYQVAGTTPISAGGQTVVQVIGQTDTITLEATTGGTDVTYDDTEAAITFDGASRGLKTGFFRIGPGYTVVASIKMNNLANNAPIAHQNGGSGDRTMLSRLKGDKLQSATWTALDAGIYNLSTVSLVPNVQYTVTSRADENTGAIIGQVNGMNRSTTQGTPPLETKGNRRVAIGWRSADYFNGQMSRLVIIPVGAVSDTDLTILEGWVGA